MRFAARAGVLFLIALCCYSIGYGVAGNRGADPGDTVNFYAPVAANLQHGDGYVIDGSFTDRYPPAFPLFLSMIYRIGGSADLENVRYRWAVVFMQSLTVVGLFVAASQWLTARQSLIAAVLLMTHPAFVAFGVTRFAWNATPLFLLFFVWAMAALLAAVRTRAAWLSAVSGLALGLSVLTWPGPVYLPFVCAAFIAAALASSPMRSQVVAVVCFLAGMAVPVGLWMWIVASHTGRIEVSSGLYPSMIHGLLYRDTALGASAVALRAAADLAAGGLQNAGSVMTFYVQQVLRHPIDLGSFMATKAAHAWYASISGEFDRISLMVQLPYIGLGAYGARLCLRRHRTHTLFMLAVIVYFWLLTLMVLAVVRYMMPALVVLFMCAAVGAEDLAQRISRRLFSQRRESPPASA